MKQTIIHTGGHPVTATDLKHLNESTFETLIALIRGLLANGTTIPNCILYGFESSPSVPSGTYFAPGAAILDGEICVFDGQTVSGSTPAPPNIRAIITSDTYLAGNPVLYADNTTKNVHLVRKAVISTVTPPLTATQLQLSGAPLFKDVLKNNLLSEDSGWIYVGGIGGVVYLNGFNDSYPGGTAEERLRYRRMFGKTVFVEGFFNFEGIGSVPSLASITGTTPLDICKLPLGFSPDDGNSYCIIQMKTPDGPCTFDAIIRSNGFVQLIRAYNYPGSVTPASFVGTNAIGRVFFNYALS